jgi:hypothetical protein
LELVWMRGRSAKALVLMVVFGCCTPITGAQPAPPTDSDPSQTGSFLLGPPKQAGPVELRARFELHDILEIDDELEAFEFSGVLTLTWNDPRQRFEPAVVGADEKVYQGNYQFDEISPGWYPQVVLVNESGSYQNSGVVLRIQPDGTSTLIQTISGVAEAELDMRRFPFDAHHLEAIFEVLGFDRGEVTIEVESGFEGALLASDVRVPEWKITASGLSTPDRSASYAGRQGVSSAFVVSVDVERRSFHMVRLVVLPLTMIVLLSFSVFWMDRSSLGDRTSVSFIGILTAVTYQVLISDNMPRISYTTLMHGFLSLSFVVMCATVVINLVVGALDQRGKTELGDRVDHRCRWAFPLVYFGLNLVFVGVAFEFF